MKRLAFAATLLAITGCVNAAARDTAQKLERHLIELRNASAPAPIFYESAKGEGFSRDQTEEAYRRAWVQAHGAAADLVTALGGEPLEEGR